MGKTLRAAAFGVTVLFLLGLPSVGTAEKPKTEAAVSKQPDVPDGWKRVDVAGKFFMRLPPEMQEKKVQGKDSLVREFRSEKITLRCDYGWYSGNLTDDGQPRYEKAAASVGGKTATLVTYGKPDGKSPLFAAIHFSDPTGDKRIKLTISAECNDLKSREVAMQILKAITFP